MELSFVGSLDALGDTHARFALASDASLVVLATAAAFRGAQVARDEIRAALVDPVTRIELEAVVDRHAADDVDTAARLRDAALVVLADGAPLHARSVWRATAVGAALGLSPLIAVGSVGSVLGTTMIDPRGGAPTTGLGLFDDVVVCVGAGGEQDVRTRALVGSGLTLVQLGPRSVVTYDGAWHVVADDELVVTRGGKPAAL